MIGWMVITSDNPANNDRIAQQIDEMFANSFAETETSSEAAFQKAFLAQIGNISLILTMIIGASFMTILVIVGTTMVMAITERTKEIAVMKTLGFQTGRIFSLVLAESIIISLFGGLLGLGLAYLAVSAIGPMMATAMPGMSMSLQIVLIAIGLMIAFGFVTGFLPALKAMNVKIVDALGKS